MAITQTVTTADLGICMHFFVLKSFNTRKKTRSFVLGHYQDASLKLIGDEIHTAGCRPRSIVISSINYQSEHLAHVFKHRFNHLAFILKKMKCLVMECQFACRCICLHVGAYRCSLGRRKVVHL